MMKDFFPLKAVFLIFFLGMSALPRPAVASDNSDCLQCHADETLTGERNGKTVSLYFDEP